MGNVSPKLRIVRHQTAPEFLREALSWLLQSEVEHSVILGIANALRHEPTSGETTPYLVTAHRGTELVACAVRTPPRKLVITRADAEAAAALARDARDAFPSLPAVSGPESAAAAFAEAWSRHSGHPPVRGTHQRLHVIEQVMPVPAPPGSLRLATEEELPLCRVWASTFGTEASPAEQAARTAMVDRYHANDSLFVWDDGGPVSMCACGGGTPSSIRVSMVYTPAQARRKGYATAAVAALSQRLLASGFQSCCLYTDLSNPTANRIYARIGYRPLCDIMDYHLAS